MHYQVFRDGILPQEQPIEIDLIIMIGQTTWSNAQYEGDLSKKYGNPDAGYYSKIPNVIFTQDLPSGFENTDMTLQIETNTIGIIYAEGDAGIDGDSRVNTGTPGIKFVPEHPDLETLPVDHEGNILGIAAKSFGTLYSESPVCGDLHSFLKLPEKHQIH